MNMFILDNEVVIRLDFFLGIFALMAGWEVAAPKRQLATSKLRRWLNNLSITAFNSFALRLVLPIQAVGAAIAAEREGIGMLNVLNLPLWQSVIASVILLDLAIYIQHLYFHKIPLFWRLHILHHVDLDVDVTTGARFHAIEIILSMIIKMGVVALLGPPVVAVLIFEILLNATSMFNHSNILMDTRTDGILRRFVVTPDMHRVHHSVISSETNSNFGFNLPWWDRIFGTYRALPEAGHEKMTLGLPQFRDEKILTLPFLLALPFTQKMQ